MITQTAKPWLGVVGILVFSVEPSAPAQAARPISISACPYTITAPGNYVVARNLSATGTCITIAPSTNNVTLDLQGDRITGNGTGYGIVCLPNNFSDRCDHILIANGTISKFSGGIFLEGNYNTVAQATSEQNTGTDNGNNPGYGTGIFLTGDFGNAITSSLAIKNAATGIAAFGGGFSSVIIDSRADDNGSNGITSAGVVSNSEADDNGGYGIAAQVITDSTARGNALSGLIGSGNANYVSVTDSNALRNGGDGIQSSGNVITSTATNNGSRGIVLFCPVSAFGNAAINNPGGNLVTSDSSCILLENKTP
jgi:hypothetical protein